MPEKMADPDARAVVSRTAQNVLTDSANTAIDVGGMRFESLSHAIRYIEEKKPSQHYGMQLDLMWPSCEYTAVWRLLYQNSISMGRNQRPGKMPLEM